MTRGRGFGMRGSYRGGGGGGGSWISGGRSRGGYGGPSRGRYNWYKESAGFEPRQRYQGVERYSNRGRMDDGGYRRYTRQDSAGYVGREHGHHRSPDSPRKRMRTEHAYVQGSTSRRSHEGSYGDYSRYGYQEEKGYGEDRRGYRDDRRGYREHSHGEHGSYSSREGYSHRKDQLDASERGQADLSRLPPPSAMSARHSSPRTSFRGKLSERGRIRRVVRGVPRMVLVRRADGLVLKKRNLMDSFAVRKRILTGRTQDYLRRLRIQKLRRIREATVAAKKKEGAKDAKKEKDEEDISAEEKEENWDDIEKDEEEEEEEELEDVEEEAEKKLKKKKKVEKPKDDKEKEKDGEVANNVGETEGTEKEKNDGEKKPEGDKSGVQAATKQDSEGRAVNEEKRKVGNVGRIFIRLHCPHCRIRCLTFKEYAMHLYSAKHSIAMRKLSQKHKQSLARMRAQQRQMQRDVEENEELNGTLTLRANFCVLCKLNYRQMRAKHQASEMHRLMKKFLTPYCRVCRLAFKSPMFYENHVASLEHIKRKSTLDRRMFGLREQGKEGENEDGSGMEEEGKELNLDNFMTLDSVGDVDGEEEEETEDGEKKEKKEGEEGEKAKKKTEVVHLGSEYIKKVEVYFCELCRQYLPRLDQPERALSIHCRLRFHLQRYVRNRDDRALRREAERIHRKEMAKEMEEEEKAKTEDKKDGETEKEQEKEAADKEGVATGDTIKKEVETGSPAKAATAGDAGAGDADMEGEQDVESGMDDKLWADVDKDLGELLREVEPTEGNKSSDEDEDSRAEGGRYDRFRYSEKGTAGAKSEGDDVAMEAEEAEIKEEDKPGEEEEVEGEAD